MYQAIQNNKCATTSELQLVPLFYDVIFYI